MIVKDIIDVCGATLYMGNSLEKCDNFKKDTREILPGDIYVGIKGARFDGSTFYNEAFEKGAKVCLLEHANLTLEEKNMWQDRTIVIVEDSVKALQQLATFKRDRYNIPVIAITGSVGKTSTKDVVASVLSQKYNVLKTQGNYNNNIGVPLTILGLKEHDCMVVEMGMNNFNELSLLTRIAKPTIAIITNIGTAHIGNLGSRENILKAKLEILEGLKQNGTVILNTDNDLLNKAYLDLKDKYNIKTIGTKECDYQATEIEEDIFSSKFKVDEDVIDVPIGGMPFIYNSLVAYAVGMELKMDRNSIKEGIKTMELSKNRLAKTVNKNGVIIIDDTYNASYDSVIASIDLLNKIKNHNKIFVFGDILELGDYTESIHRSIGEYISKSNIDRLITVGENSKFTEEEVIKKGFNKENHIHFKTQEEVYPYLVKILKKDDVILLKASHGINLNKVVEKLNQE